MDDYIAKQAGKARSSTQMIWEAERPFIYAGGGIILGKASAELREFVDLVDAPLSALSWDSADSLRITPTSSACPACTAATPPTWA